MEINYASTDSLHISGKNLNYILSITSSIHVRDRNKKRTCDMTESAIIFATVRPPVDTTSSSEHLSKVRGDAKKVVVLGGKYHKV